MRGSEVRAGDSGIRAQLQGDVSKSRNVYAEGKRHGDVQPVRADEGNGAAGAGTRVYGTSRGTDNIKGRLYAAYLHPLRRYLAGSVHGEAAEKDEPPEGFSGLKREVPRHIQEEWKIHQVSDSVCWQERFHGSKNPHSQK